MRGLPSRSTPTSSIGLAREHEVVITIEEGAIGGFGSHVLHHLAMSGMLDRGLKIRTMVLPDVFLDHDSPQAQYERPGSTPAISWRWPYRRSAARSPCSRRGLSIGRVGAGRVRVIRKTLMRAEKRRADQLLVDQGLVESRAKAQALILAGVVSCAGRRVNKPGERLAADAALALKERDHPWVSRGGVKLAHALDHFEIAVDSKIALDIGASTGGFTDVLLARGAARVYAVDVGHGQLAWKLRQDPRVVVHERLNARNLSRAEMPEPVDIITCDASFIGLRTVLPAPLALAAERGELIALIKPQFEAGREQVGKGGVVRDPALHRDICQRVAGWIGAQPGWNVGGVVESPLFGSARELRV